MESRIELIRDRLQEGVQARIFPGCSLALIDHEQVTILTTGSFTYDTTSPPVTPATIYDTASITKIVTTMTLAMQLLDEGVLSLSDTVGNYLPEFANSPDKKKATIAHLMTYTINYYIPEGAKAALPYTAASEVLNDVITAPVKETPGSSYMYTNITAFLLTQIIERATGKNFETLVQDRVFTPLGMATAILSPTPDQYPMIPPSELTTERGEVRGFVHDEFTYYMRKGGVSNGAAGLFASVLDLVPFLQMTLHGGIYQGKRLLSDDIVSRWTKDYFPQLLPTHTPVGWGDSPNNQFIDMYVDHKIVVKGGFTGCLMYGDLTQNRGLILLSNRTYPKRPDDPTAFSTFKRDVVKIIFD